ncbi:hypothetical protein DXF96_03005 [Heyndrickxia coagulans]|nr:hypothetical protein CYJ15_15510 [Heyndrickxia coagulans]QDI60585.1 hypothetical protein DXF96_03005 [Heyndrickxia coagulans]
MIVKFMETLVGTIINTQLYHAYKGLPSAGNDFGTAPFWDCKCFKNHSVLKGNTKISTYSCEVL